MKRSVIFIFIFFIGVLFLANAAPQQDPASTPVEEVDENSKSLYQQFVNLKDKSNTYQEYKVVKVTWLNGFWKNVKDSLEAAKSDFSVAQTEIEKQNAELENLKKTLAQKELEVNSSEYEKAHISVLGMDVLKSNYIIFNWTIILILLALVGVTFYSHKNSQKFASLKKADYDAIDKELVDFKAKAREKELRIKRELQTEMNRVEELNQEIALLRKQSTPRS